MEDRQTWVGLASQGVYEALSGCGATKDCGTENSTEALLKYGIIQAKP